MNLLAVPDIPIAEKRCQRTTMIVLIDRRGRCVWNSLEPFSNDEPKSIIDYVPVESRERVLEMLSRCIVAGEIMEYVTRGETPRSDPNTPSEDMVNWQVTLFPTNDRFPVVAAVAVCRILPPNHDEITAEDKNLLQMLCEDCTLKEIAVRMFLSESAIDSRIKNLKLKLGVKNIGGLVASALSQSVI